MIFRKMFFSKAQMLTNFLHVLNFLGIIYKLFALVHKVIEFFSSVFFIKYNSKKYLASIQQHGHPDKMFLVETIIISTKNNFSVQGFKSKDRNTVLQ